MNYKKYTPFLIGRTRVMAWIKASNVIDMISKTHLVHNQELAFLAYLNNTKCIFPQLNNALQALSLGILTKFLRQRRGYEDSYIWQTIRYLILSLFLLNLHISTFPLVNTQLRLLIFCIQEKVQITKKVDNWKLYASRFIKGRSSYSCNQNNLSIWIELYYPSSSVLLFVQL